MQLFLRREVAPLVRKLHYKEGRIMKRVMAAALGLTLGVVSTAWAQRSDRNVDQPVVRSLNWFSYVAAEDVRATCRTGGRSRLRLVYNALWEEQVRAYGGPRYQVAQAVLSRFAEAIEKSKVDIVPRVLVGGGGGPDGSRTGNVLETLFALFVANQADGDAAPVAARPEVEAMKQKVRSAVFGKMD